MKARLLIRERVRYADDSFIEMVVWRVPKPVPPTTHGLKYRLAYVVGGTRVLGYDNERGKGDHRHVEGRDEAYSFTTVDDLMARFVLEVEALRRRR